MKSRHIEVVGATTHNLKNISVVIPGNALTAVMGVSGSGKSSLVDGTIAAVAAERTRRFLALPGTGQGPDIPAFVGATPPLISVAQQAFQANSRTTVATSSALMRVLRRIFVRYSAPFCTEFDEYVPDPAPEIFARWLCNFGTGKAIVWAVPVYQARTDGVSAMRALATADLPEAIVYSETDKGGKIKTGTCFVPARFKKLRADVRHTIEAKVGEVRIGKAGASKLLNLIKVAWAAGNGHVFIELPEAEKPDLARAFSSGLDSRRHRVHPEVRHVYRAADAHLFSFNAPGHEDSGACPVCLGLGVMAEVQEQSLVIHPERSMNEGAFALWTEKNYRHVNIQHATLEGLRGRNGFDPDLPWRRLPASAKSLVLNGCEEPIADVDPRTGKKVSLPHCFEGFRAAILRRVGRQSAGATALGQFVATGTCQACEGSRWRMETRALRVGSYSIDVLLALPFSALLGAVPAWRRELESDARHREDMAELGVLIEHIEHIARAFVNVGLGHLTGTRGLLEVSDGELRRSKLASVLNSRLSGLLLVLDEPGRGLHEADLAHLSQVISEVANTNTVLMSEHRMRLVQHAQHIIRLGPEGGMAGGHLIPPAIFQATRTQTASLVNLPGTSKAAFLRIRGGSCNTVQQQDVRIPLGRFTCIAGVSGSGKSSFARGVLVPALCSHLGESAVDVADFRMLSGQWTACSGMGHIKALVALDQIASPRQSRSLVATYLGIAEQLRQEFAGTEQARLLGFSATDFGTNAGRGRCQSCLGLGMAADGGPCVTCGGLRFGYDALSVRVAGRNMAEWLDTTVSELSTAPFAWLAPEMIHSLVELGIGHLALGRGLATLSGGEVQRLRLARAISAEASAGTMFVLDEPACGLHACDVDRLYRALRHLVGNGKNTVVVMEHDPVLLSRCDHIVEFGPGGGPAGGQVVFQGTPTEVRAENTATGWALSHPSEVMFTSDAQGHDEGDAGAGPESLAEALMARQELRLILGDDVVSSDEEVRLQMAAIFESADAKVRLLELGGLDRSLISIALNALPCPEPRLKMLLRLWAETPGAQLHVNPLLEAVSVWGRDIPASVIEHSRKEAKAMGLNGFGGPGENPLELRVTGRRLHLADSAAAADRELALRDAWALGSGFVELLDATGQSVISVSARLMDTERGMVGPRRPRIDHFIRSSSPGACPMCQGKGHVPSLRVQGMVGNTRAGVLDDDFLAPELAGRLKGFRRSIMIPFFRRMTEEGIWKNVGWNSLPDAQKHMIMWGYWVRPGLGSFLKTGKGMDGTEVNHWLKWDGLATELSSSRLSGYPHQLFDEMPHGCPACEGSGLSQHSAMLQLAGRSMQEWTLSGRVHEMFGALTRMRSKLNARDRHELQRVLRCIRPIKDSVLPLADVVSTDLRFRMLALIAKEFTGLATFFA